MNKPTNATANFAWREFYCPLAKSVPVSDLTLHHVSCLQELREQFGQPLKVNSGYRSPEHNTRVGGAPQSMHLEFATDITPAKVGEGDRMQLLDALNDIAEELKFSGIGRYDIFLHLDCRAYIGRTPARWDKRSAP